MDGLTALVLATFFLGVLGGFLLSIGVVLYAIRSAQSYKKYEVNAELVEALRSLVVAVDKHELSTEFQRPLSKADYALRKAQGNNKN